MTLPRSWSFGAEPVSRDRCSDGSPGGSMEGTTSTWDTDSAEFTQDTSHESESHELKHKLDLKQQLVDQLYHMQQNERFAARKLVAQLCNKIEGLEVEVKEAKTLANEEIRDREGQDKLMEDLKALLEVKEAELQRCSTAEFQLAKAQEEIQVRDEKIADLQHQLQTAEEGLEHLLEELASRDKMIEILQDYLDMEEEKQETMEEALSSLSSDLQQSKLQVEELGHSAECSAFQIRDLEQRLEVAQDVIDHLMEEKRDGEEHCLRIQEDCECKVASQDALIEHLQAERRQELGRRSLELICDPQEPLHKCEAAAEIGLQELSPKGSLVNQSAQKREIRSRNRPSDASTPDPRGRKNNSEDESDHEEEDSEEESTQEEHLQKTIFLSEELWSNLLEFIPVAEVVQTQTRAVSRTFSNSKIWLAHLFKLMDLDSLPQHTSHGAHPAIEFSEWFDALRVEEFDRVNEIERCASEGFQGYRVFLNGLFMWNAQHPQMVQPFLTTVMQWYSSGQDVLSAIGTNFCGLMVQEVPSVRRPILVDLLSLTRTKGLSPDRYETFIALLRCCSSVYKHFGRDSVAELLVSVTSWTDESLKSGCLMEIIAMLNVVLTDESHAVLANRCYKHMLNFEKQGKLDKAAAQLQKVLDLLLEKQSS